MLKTKAGFSAHVLLPVIAILAVLGMGGYVAKHTYDVSQERKQFMAAKAEVNKLGDAIAAETKPTKHQAVQFCDYGHAKLGPVGRTCWVKYYSMFSDVNANKAVMYYTSAKNIISQGYDVDEFQDGSSVDFSEMRGLNITGKYKKSCGLYLDYNDEKFPVYYNRRSFPGMNFDPTKNSAILTLSCSGEAKAEYFSVRKS